MALALVRVFAWPVTALVGQSSGQKDSTGSEDAPETHRASAEAALEGGGDLADAELSLLTARLPCEALAKDRVKALMVMTLQDPQIALDIGRLAGIPAVFKYGCSGREHGRAMRDALPVLYSSALPSIYVCGGASVFRGVLDTVHRFNTEIGSWDEAPPMQTARRLCAAAVCGGFLYVFGGECEELSFFSWRHSSWRQYKQLSSAECFDPFKNQWKSVPEMSKPRAGCSAAAIGGMLYVTGGRQEDEVQKVVERFDTGTARWEKLPEMPSARSGCMTAALFGMLYVLGGKGHDNHILSSMERLDPSIGWWQKLPSMQTCRSAGACACVGGKLFVVGGFNGAEGMSRVEAFDPLTGAWEERERMLTWRIGAAAAAVGGKLYVLGGKTVGDQSALMCERYEPSSDSWSCLPAMPERHVYCASGAVVGFV